ncbi:hypothetical protein CI738_05425 [Escherichia coli]|nr:hypothetical protein CI738_05425 [Escherichia coli]
MLETVCLRYSPKGRQRKAPPDYKSKFVLTPKSWTVKHEAYRSDSDIQLESDLGNDSNLLIVFYVQIMPDDFVMQLHRF